MHYEIFEGDPSKPEVWDRLDAFLKRGWPSEWGWNKENRATCIDTGGHRTELVYKFCQPREARRIWAVKAAEVA